MIYAITLHCGLWQEVRVTVTAILMDQKTAFVAVKPDARIESIIDLMMKNGVGSVAVVNDSGLLEGMIAERDILKAIDTRLSALAPVKARDIMSRRVPTCALDESESTLMERMISGGVQYLPVVDGSETIAIVSMVDVVENRVKKVKNLMKEIADAIHIEGNVDYFTRHLKPQRSTASAMMQDRKVG